MKGIDITGQRFGRLTVISYQGYNKHRAALWLCKCDCGKEVITTGSNLRKGKTQSCGCIQREIASKELRKFNASGKRITNGHLIHGDNKTRLHRTWCQMRRRCRNPNYEHYDRYGGRGIKVCEEWENSYIAFREWALANGYQDNLSIDRIDNDGNYEPGNCRWVDQTSQVRNRSNTVFLTIDGETKTLKAWCEERGIGYKLAHARLKKGYSLDEIFKPLDIETRLTDG